MSDGIDQLRADLARERGLPAGAESFLTASTLDELEEQADALARALGTPRAAPEPKPTPAPNPFAIASEQKQQRKRQLAAMFTGRAPQLRDKRGRFAGFDGGARTPVPETPDPLRDHDALVAELARVRRIFGGSDF